MSSYSVRKIMQVVTLSVPDSSCETEVLSILGYGYITRYNQRHVLNLLTSPYLQCYPAMQGKAVADVYNDLLQTLRQFRPLVYTELFTKENHDSQIV